MKKYFFIFFYSLTLIILFGLWALSYILDEKKEILRTIIEVGEQAPSLVYDDQGNELFRFENQHTLPLSLSAISANIINAFIAIEDRTFFFHSGISLKGIIRSIGANIWSGRLSQGASTITQQLVRLTLLSQEKTWVRKCKEIGYTLLLEMYYTKEQILQAYFNHAYFGAGIYGITQACKIFFNTTVDQVSLAQAATLAGIIQSPARFCPLKSIDRALKRRNTVLQAMRTCNMIDQSSYESAVAEPLILYPKTADNGLEHLKTMVRKEATKRGYKNLAHQGLRINLTINKTMQTCAQKEFHAQFALLKKEVNQTLDGGLICIDNKTGAIKALIGGYDGATSCYNRATQAKRQIGSTIKPLIYAYAVSQQIPLTTVMIDQPVSYTTGKNIWQPSNYDKKYRGPMTLAYALAHSNNIVTIKLLEKITPQAFAPLIKESRLGKQPQPHLSLALGCIDTSLLAIARMFSIFANNGTPVEPFLIQSIYNQQNDCLWMHKKTTLPQIINSKATLQIRSVLEHALANVYKKKLTVPAMGKTGTTNDCRTCFFVGATPSWTTALYCGCDDNKPIGKNIFPAATVLPLWVSFNKKIQQPALHFYTPPESSVSWIDPITGLKTNFDPDKEIIKIIS